MTQGQRKLVNVMISLLMMKDTASISQNKTLQIVLRRYELTEHDVKIAATRARREIEDRASEAERIIGGMCGEF